MRQLIILSDRDIADIESGQEVELKIRDEITVVLMDDITYESKYGKGDNTNNAIQSERKRLCC